jgi:hypothetical protein
VYPLKGAEQTTPLTGVPLGFVAVKLRRYISSSLQAKRLYPVIFTLEYPWSSRISVDAAFPLQEVKKKQRIKKITNRRGIDFIVNTTPKVK